MNINQKNVFGNNNINIIQGSLERTLDIESKKEILERLKQLKVKNIKIRFESDSETENLVLKVINFLNEKNYDNIILEKVFLSEIQRQQFSIELNPSDKEWAIISIGKM